LDKVLFELLVKYPITTYDEIAKKRLETQLSPKEKSIYTIIQNRPNIQSGEISEKLAIPLPTVKRILSELINKGLIEKQGKRTECELHYTIVIF
jgi:DNA-binding MarR family transcriptional regulator